MATEHIIPTPSSPLKTFEFFSEHTNGFNKFFRGQSKFRYDLDSSLGRAFKPDRTEGLRNAENMLYDEFARQGQSRITNSPQLDDVISWMILMQHYSAPTRLLDWTGSPFVAIYFAYRTPKPKEACSAALWLLDKTVSEFYYSTNPTKSVVGYSIWNKEDIDDNYSAITENEKIRAVIANQYDMPYIVYPRRADQRMNSQKGILTVCPNKSARIPYPLEIKRYPWQEETMNHPFPIHAIQKMELPWEWREEVLIRLNLMGINESTLFPNLDGLGKHMGWLLDRYTNGYK